MFHSKKRTFFWYDVLAVFKIDGSERKCFFSETTSLINAFTSPFGMHSWRQNVKQMNDLTPDDFLRD